jgi:hypothetical protein
MTEAVRPIEFSVVANGEKKGWRRPGSFAFANHISQVPLSSTEILLTSHHLPVAIDYVDDRPRVVAIVNPHFQRAPAVAPDGRWRKGYMPIALRCLPFRLTEGAGGSILEIAVNLAEADEPEKALFNPDKSFALQVQQIEALLRLLEEGKQQLQKAAEKLLIADVLRPFQFSNRNQDTSPRTFTVDRNKFGALSHARVASIVRDSFLPIDLAAACIFSQRLMATLVSVAPDDENRKGTGPAVSAGIDDMLTAMMLDVEVDDGELFSFEHFEETQSR